MIYKRCSYNNVGLESVILVETQAYIPFDPANTDYQEYLKWLSEGNTPLPADEPQQPEVTPAPEPEVVPSPEPEVVPTSEPEAVPAPEPEAVPAPEPEAVPAPEPEAVPAPEQETPAP